MTHSMQTLQEIFLISSSWHSCLFLAAVHVHAIWALVSMLVHLCLTFCFMCFLRPCCLNRIYPLQGEEFFQFSLLASTGMDHVCFFLKCWLLWVMLVFVTKATATFMEGVTSASTSHLTCGKWVLGWQTFGRRSPVDFKPGPLFSRQGAEVLAHVSQRRADQRPPRPGGLCPELVVLTRFRCNRVGWHLTLQGWIWDWPVASAVW